MSSRALENFCREAFERDLKKRRVGPGKEAERREAHRRKGMWPWGRKSTCCPSQPISWATEMIQRKRPPKKRKTAQRNGFPTLIWCTILQNEVISTQWCYMEVGFSRYVIKCLCVKGWWNSSQFFFHDKEQSENLKIGLAPYGCAARISAGVLVSKGGGGHIKAPPHLLYSFHLRGRGKEPKLKHKGSLTKIRMTLEAGAQSRSLPLYCS